MLSRGSAQHIGLIFSGAGYLSPIVAALLHNAGAVVVIFNSGRLIRSGEELETPTAEAPQTARVPV